MKALVVLADGCEELEAVAIIDLLRRAQVSVTVCAAQASATVQGAHGIAFQADETLTAAPEALAAAYDLAVSPGGMGCMEALRANPAVLAVYRAFAAAGRFHGAICASPAVLDAAGLLAGKRYCCYPGIQQMIPNGTYVPDVPALRDGTLLTGAGPGTAVPFALLLIEALAGRETRDEVAAGLLLS